jgi:tetratricopeptide (TPR) repeat protein
MRTFLPRILPVLAFVFILEPSCSSSGKKVDLETQAVTKAPSPAGNPGPQKKPEEKSTGQGLASEKPSDATQPVSKPLEPAPAMSSRCEGLLRQIQALDAAFPKPFQESKRSSDEINQDLIRSIELCRTFLSECSGAQACDARAILAKDLLIRNARYKEELERACRKELEEKQKTASREEVKALKEKVEACMTEVPKKMEAYMNVILELAGSARSATECGAQSKARQTALRVLCDANRKLGKSQEVEKYAAELLKEYPDYDERGSLNHLVGEAMLAEGRYEEAVKYLRKAISEHSDDPVIVLLNDKLFEGLTGTGDLEGMEELLHLMRAEYPARLDSMPEGILKTQYEIWTYMSFFWLGFVRMALGDDAGARSYFQEYAAAVESLQAQLAAKGQSLNVVLKVTLEFRAQDLLYFFDNYRGKKPQVDFDLENLWATEKKLTLRDAEGKVVAAVFRRPGDYRARTFLQEIDRLAKEREKDGLCALALGFLTGGAADPDDDAKALQSMREEMTRFGLSLPSGYDPDRKGQSIFRSLHATVGTATFIAFNKKGEIAWLLADPRDMDRKIAARVLDRLLKE